MKGCVGGGSLTECVITEAQSPMNETDDTGDIQMHRDV